MTRCAKGLLSAVVAGLVLVAASELVSGRRGAQSSSFHLHEATIADIQSAIVARQVSTVQLVELYLQRIKAYNGTCVEQPDGLLGATVSTIPKAGQINALITLNLRPATRRAWGFDDRKARSMTDAADSDPAMPDALEVAAEHDRLLQQSGRLVGPLHGVVLSIKDQYDTFDMRSTSGGDVAYANDRPPDDATFITRLREAGAIVLAKANVGNRSAFGGTPCNPYDTERTSHTSSSGSASSVAANLVTCAIGEETGISIRGPARAHSLVGISPTQELVSRDGMSGAGINMRTGPICRTVEDAARVLTVIAGFDEKDPLTAFSVGKRPAQPYEAFTHGRRLEGVRIGVVREFMDKRLFSPADAESIDIVVRALDDLRRIGATIVDPGPEGALFQGCVRQHGPQAMNTLFTRLLPETFPIDDAGRPTTDHIATLVDMAFDPSRVPDVVTIRDMAGNVQAIGEGPYMRSRYLRERGDANVRTLADLAVATRRVQGSPSSSATATPAGAGAELNMADRMLQRFAFQQIVLQCMAEQNLDAVTYPTTNLPPRRIDAPEEPVVNGRVLFHWFPFGYHGFPEMTVPAGFTTHVYDRVADSASPDGTRLSGPVPAVLPVGINFTARPFDEPTMLRIAAAYAAATMHRRPPAEFGPLVDEP